MLWLQRAILFALHFSHKAMSEKLQPKCAFCKLELRISDFPFFSTVVVTGNLVMNSLQTILKPPVKHNHVTQSDKACERHPKLH